MQVAYSSMYKMKNRLENLSGFFNGFIQAAKGFTPETDSIGDFLVTLPDDTSKDVIALIRLFESEEIVEELEEPAKA